ncbi:hypothetical protein C8F01DRAFT_1091863 [Mycena amicta]|nr:hypothetical protein C8F01DRAFT_1091863 [Mycena amicta]
MGEFDDAFGTLLIGSWLAFLVSGAAIPEVIRYFRKHPDDSAQRKGFVSLCILMCLVALAGDCSEAYLLTVTFWVPDEFAALARASISLYVLGNGMIGVLVDSFLISRFYALNLWVTCGLSLIVLAAFGSSIAVTIALQTSDAVATGRHKVHTTAIIWLVCEAAADVGVAAALIWKLRTMRTSFEKTNTLIHRLVLGAIQTGAVTSLLAILVVITFVHNPTSNVETGIVYLTAPCYLHTLLYNVNLRHRSRSHSAGGTRIASSGSRSNNNHIGIHVHRTAVLTVDGEPHELGHTHTASKMGVGLGDTVRPGIADESGFLRHKS